MEKYVFLSMLRTNLLQMNVPTDNIVKHVEVFEKYFSSKTPEETKKIIKGIGGLDGALEAVYKVESKRNPNIIKPSELKKNTVESNSALKEQDIPVVKKASFEEVSSENEDPQEVAVQMEQSETCEISIEKNNESTKEIPAIHEFPLDENVDLIFKKRQNAKVREEMEKTTVNNVTVMPDDNFEFATEIPPLEDEIMAYKHPSRLVEFFKNIRSKMSDNVYKYTLPLTMFLNILGYVLLIALFPVLSVVTAVFYALYFVCMIGGILVSLLSLVYGIIKMGSAPAVGLYEMGIGFIVIGITLLVCILLSLFNKKLMPFLFSKAKELFKLWIKANKAFFRKHAKGGRI